MDCLADVFTTDLCAFFIPVRFFLLLLDGHFSPIASRVSNSLPPLCNMLPETFILTMVPAALWVAQSPINGKSVVACSFKCARESTCQGFVWQNGQATLGTLANPNDVSINMEEMIDVFLSTQELDQVKSVVDEQKLDFFQSGSQTVGNATFLTSKSTHNFTTASKICHNFGGILAHPYHENEWNALTASLAPNSNTIIGLETRPGEECEGSCDAGVAAIWSDNVTFVGESFYNCIEIHERSQPVIVRIRQRGTNCGSNFFLDDAPYYTEYQFICQF